MSLPDTATIDSYGGVKVNFGPIEDPTTDRDAALASDAYGDVAGMTQTAFRTFVRFTCATGVAPALAEHWAVWGNQPLTVTPPTPGRTGAGVFTMTWPATTTDALGVTRSTALRSAICSVEGAAFKFAQASVIAPNVVQIDCGLINGTHDDLNGVTLALWAR